MKFSQRIGITPAYKDIQIASIDADLRNGLWNVLQTNILDKLSTYYVQRISGLPFFVFANSLWANFLKLSTDSIPPYKSQIIEKIKYVYFAANWHEVYDLVEFSTKEIRNKHYEIDYLKLDSEYNRILEREFSAYRFIDGILSPITNDHERVEIETALNNSGSFTHLSGCNIHLSQALKMLSDKVSPDYRNSIKESISAIESVAKIIAENKKDELGTALNVLKTKANINAGLVAGFKSIYGWTSNSDGIRHGLMDEPNCDFDDAKYMLVSSSAFINYLISKAHKAGIVLK